MSHLTGTAHTEGTTALFLREMVAALDLDPDLVDRLNTVGNDRLPSCFAVSDFAAAAIGAAGLSAAELLAVTGRGRPNATVNRHLANAWFGRSIEPVGWELPAPWDPIAGDYRADDGWIRLHTNAPSHRRAALDVLDCAPDRVAVADAVSRLGVNALEQAIVDRGGCAAAMRTIEAWREHPQGRAVGAEPLIAWSRRAASATNGWAPSQSRPLAGIRVLDLTRVLAGPVATRFLAGLGADVLRIDPPEWDEPGVVPDVTLGKRCARLDLHNQRDRAKFEARLAEADLLIHGFRPNALERLGYGATARARINPNLIEVTLDAYGWSGAWAARRGFDSLVQMSCGIAAAGMVWRSADAPVPLPVQALDHATGYLMAAAALRALIARTRENAVASARLSLARTANLLLSVTSESGAPPFVSTDQDFDDYFEETSWGKARRLVSPVTVGNSPLYWRSPAVLLGSSDAGWWEMHEQHG